MELLLLMSLWTPTAPSEAPGMGPLAPGQRWCLARKRAVVLRLLGGESIELLSRELGVPVYKLERWREKAEAGLEGALKEREADTADGELAAAMHRIGELSVDVELLRTKMEHTPGPFGPQEAAVMAETVSPAAGRRYGVARVCQVWGVPRSSVSARHRDAASGRARPARIEADDRRCRRGHCPLRGDGPLDHVGPSGRIGEVRRLSRISRPGLRVPQGALA